MIRKVVLRRFKRFEEVTFEMPGHIVLAGPNNTGKTTLLQAIAAWSLAFNRWKQLNDFNKHGGAYTRAPIARQAFAAVPLRSFELLWNRRDYKDSIAIELHGTDGWHITMELISDSTEQIYARPAADTDAAHLRELTLNTVYVPPMSGLSTDEPVYTRPKQDQLLGQGKPGDIIRNLLVDAYNEQEAWVALQQSIRRLFDQQLLPPNAEGADIIAEYQAAEGGPRFDVASAGSGFQQVLMLLTFLHTRPASLLLLDEPDAHLYVILQDVIYSELKAVAEKRNSQLLIATHSEVIINSVEPKQLCMLIGSKPRILESVAERALLVRCLGILTNADIMQALDAPGILYVEGHTDIAALRAWAKVLGHPAHEMLTRRLFWKPTIWEPRFGAKGITSKDHYEALRLVRPDMPGLTILDGDDNPNITETPLTGQGLQRLRWQRYEIESYLFHPAALERFVLQKVGAGASGEHIAELRKHLQDTNPPPFLQNPLGDFPFLRGTKARKYLIPPALAAAGLPEIEYTDYAAIAEVMLPTEIHPEVVEKLDGIQKAFGL